MLNTPPRRAPRLLAPALGGLLVAALLLQGGKSLARAEPIPPAAAAPAAGRIEGSVTISSSLSERRPRFRPYNDPGTGNVPPAPPADPIAAELRNVVVYLEGDSTVLPAPAARVEAHRHGSIAQRDEQFAPHVLAVMEGATVDFPNDDDVYHNVFSISGAKTFDLGRYPKGSSKSEVFPRPGTVPVFCHIHADMSAVVLVVPNPYFASPGDDHHYSIDDVPEGDYTLVAWHERLRKPITKRIHVTAGQTTYADFNIPLPAGGK